VSSRRLTDLSRRSGLKLRWRDDRPRTLISGKLYLGLGQLFCAAHPPDHFIDREESGAEGEDDQRDEEIEERGGAGEGILVFEEIDDGVVVGGEVGDDEVDRQGDADQAGGQAQEKEQAAGSFERGDEVGVRGRHRDVQVGEEVDETADVLQLPFPGLKEPPAEYESKQQQERAAQPVEATRHGQVIPADQCAEHEPP
jgi:hypothetical protein